MEKKLLPALILTLLSSAALATDDASKTDKSMGGAATSDNSNASSASANNRSSVSFDSLDTNKDGSLSQAEYNASFNADTGNRLQGAATTEDPNDPMLRTPLEKQGIQRVPERPTSVAPAGDLPDKVMDQTDPIMLQGR